MEKLMRLIKDKFEQSQVNYSSSENVSVDIQNGLLDTIQSSKNSSYSVRAFKDKQMGSAYTNSIDDPKQILESLDISFKGNVEADFELPGPEKLPELNNYDKAIEAVDSKVMFDISEKIYRYIKSRIEAEISTFGYKLIYENKLINSKGVNYYGKYSISACGASLTFPGGGGHISKTFFGKGELSYSEKELDKLIELFKAGLTTVNPEGGNMKVLFMPESMYTITWRLIAAAKADTVDQGVSVLKNRIGEKIFSDKITIHNDPLNDKLPITMAFDEEGVVNKRNYLVEKGVFKNFYGNLKYCKKIGIAPTGGSSPESSTHSLYLEPGNDSLEDLISKMDKGIIVFNPLGPHSGNIPNGDFSIGTSPCMYVENGRILGRVKDAMIAGNIYEVMKNVIAVGDKAEYAHMVISPPVLLDNMNVSIKK